MKLIYFQYVSVCVCLFSRVFFSCSFQYRERKNACVRLTSNIGNGVRVRMGLITIFCCYSPSILDSHSLSNVFSIYTRIEFSRSIFREMQSDSVRVFGAVCEPIPEKNRPIQSHFNRYAHA